MECIYDLGMSNVNLKNSKYRVLDSYNCNVFRIQDELSTCIYILKVCDEMESDRYKHQFKTEIDVLSKLNSLLVPSLVTCFEEGTLQCFVETYIPGISAKQFVQQYKGVIQRYRLLFDVLSVLQAVHEIGYLYIDLKLENIIYYQKHFYLIDFNACIENHAHVAIMASKSNCAPELMTLSKKDIRCDIYALGSLLQEVFGVGMILIIYLCHQKKERRISNLSIFKFLIIIHILIRILLVLLLCILSVFSLFKCTSPKNVFDAYYYHHQIAMFEKAYKESESKDQLYMWISNGWILDDVYVNKQASIFLMKEALKTKDATLIQYMYDRISLNKTPELEACALIYLKPTTSTIARCMRLVLTSDMLLKDKLDVVNQCLQIAIHDELNVSLTPIKDWLENVETNQLLNYSKEFEDLGCNYLEYLFLLRNKESEIMEIPLVFIDNLKSSRWNDLYAFWRSL